MTGGTFGINKWGCVGPELQPRQASTLSARTSHSETSAVGHRESLAISPEDGNLARLKETPRPRAAWAWADRKRAYGEGAVSWAGWRQRTPLLRRYRSAGQFLVCTMLVGSVLPRVAKQV